MDSVALPARGGKLVLPADAMGYTTGDGRRILAWDYASASFYLDDQSTRTHGQVMLNDVLTPPAFLLAHPPVGNYAVSSTHGQCRVDEVTATAILVRSATAFAAVMPDTLRPLGSGDSMLLKDVRLILECGTAFVFSNVFSAGGAMGTVDVLLRRINAKVTGEIAIYECMQPHGLLAPLRKLGASSSTAITLHGQITVPPAAVEGVVRTTAASALWHARVFRWLEANPWVLPCTMKDLWRKLGRSRAAPRPDAAQVPHPWALQEGMVVSRATAPAKLTRRSKTMPAARFICAVRSGGILPVADGRYVLGYSDGSWGEIKPDVDLAAAAADLEDFARTCTQPGLYHVRDALPTCPELLFREMFGSGYDGDAGTFHRPPFS